MTHGQAARKPTDLPVASPQKNPDPKEESQHRLIPLDPTLSLQEGHRTEEHVESQQEDVAAQPRRQEADSDPGQSPQPTSLKWGGGRR